MSAKAIDWARKAQVKKNNRYVLIELSMLASEQNGQHVAWPSAKSLAESTGLDLKTVKQCLTELLELGFIVDTGERTGATNQVRVFMIPVEKTISIEPKNGTVKQTQKRNDSENGTNPVLVANEPKNGTENEPKNGTGNKLRNKLRINNTSASKIENDLPAFEQVTDARKKTYRQLDLKTLPESWKAEVRKRSTVSDARLEMEFVKFDAYWLKDKVSGVSNTAHDWACQFAGQVRANLLTAPDDSAEAFNHVHEVFKQQQQRQAEAEQKAAAALPPDQARQQIKNLRKHMALTGGLPHGNA